MELLYRIVSGLSNAEQQDSIKQVLVNDRFVIVSIVLLS